MLGPVPLPPPEEVFPPPLSACEVHIGPAVTGCFECIPGLLVCPAHFSPCGGLSLLCCNFCLKVLCLKHFYCPCSEAIERRCQVSVGLRQGAVSRRFSSVGPAVLPDLVIDIEDDSEVESAPSAVAVTSCLLDVPSALI